MAEMPQRRRPAAILAAEVADYRRHMARDEAGTLARLAAHRRELCDPLVTAHGGRIIKLLEEGALCELGSAVAAVECAVALQRGMAEREAGSGPEEHISLRIGLALGEVVVDGEGAHGGAVDVAAGLQALAEPGGVCLSGSVHDEVRGRTAYRLAARGAWQLDDMDHPVRVYAIALDPQAERAVGGRR
jgi:adenylate cyclase